MRCWAYLILSKCYSLYLSLWLGVWSQNPMFLAYLTLLNCQGSCNPSVIKCAFIFHTRNVFGCFCCVMALFKLVKPKFLNPTTLHVHFCSFQITQSESMFNVSVHKLLQNYLPEWVRSMARTASVMWYMHYKLACTKTLQNSWLILAFYTKGFLMGQLTDRTGGLFVNIWGWWILVYAWDFPSLLL